MLEERMTAVGFCFFHRFALFFFLFLVCWDFYKSIESLHLHIGMIIWFFSFLSLCGILHQLIFWMLNQSYSLRTNANRSWHTKLLKSILLHLFCKDFKNFIISSWGIVVCDFLFCNNVCQVSRLAFYGSP